VDSDSSFFLFLSAGASLAQQLKAAEPAPVVQSGPVIVPAPNTVFIAPMNGFDTYLAAAFNKKQMPLILIADEAHAAYIIRGT
jgi:hypothetical protein